MALFMDAHTLEGGVSAGDVAQAHTAPTWPPSPRARVQGAPVA